MCVCVYVNSITVIRYSDVDGVGGVAAIVFSTPPLPPIIFSSTIFLSPGSYFIQELEQIRQVWRRLFILSPSCAEPGFSEILWDSLRYWDRGGGGLLSFQDCWSMILCGRQGFFGFLVSVFLHLSFRTLWKFSADATRSFLHSIFLLLLLCIFCCHSFAWSSL